MYKLYLTRTLRNSIVKSPLKFTIYFLLLLGNLFAVNLTHGQTTSSTAKGGRPTGSYTLDNFDNVNLFNGNLNFSMPLLSVNGRGEAGVTVPLTLETRWKLIRSVLGQQTQYSYEPESIAGVMVNGAGKLVPSISTYQWYETNPTTCGQAESQPQYAKLILNFTTSNGTSYQLRSIQNNGAPYQVPECYPGMPQFNHGTEFIAWDGSGTKFVSDASILSMVEIQGDVLSGYLLLPNGTRYRIDDGLTSWIEDRDGNRTTFTYYSGSTPNSGNTYSGQGSIFVNTITDSIGRQITFQYNQSESPYGSHTKITYKGFGGAERVIRISYKNLQDALHPQSTNFPFLPVVSDVWLPDNRKYSFLYSSYGQLARVTLPTGGKYEYDYDVIFAPQQPPQPQNLGTPYIRVSERRVYSDGVNLSQKTIFSHSSVSPNSITTVDNYDHTSTRLSRSKHYFHGDPAPQFPLQGNDVYEDEDAWNKGREYKSESYSSDGTTLLRKTETEWEAGRYVTWNPYGAGNTNVYRDARVASSTTTLADSNQVSKTTYLHNQGIWVNVPYNVQTDVFSYDWGLGAHGSFLRRKHTEYTAYTGNYLTSNYILRLPTESWVSSDVNGNNKVSLTQNEYDNYANDANHAPLLNRSNITGHNSNYGTNFTTRGNVTKVTNYANAASQTGAVSVYAQYDIAGNVVKAIDGKGYANTIDYSDRFGAPDAEARSNSAPGLLNGQETFAFATSITNITGYTTHAQYDYFTNAGVDSEDIIGNVNSTYYNNDPFDRPTQTILANNRPQFRNRKNISYDDTNRKITITSDSKAFGDNLMKTEAFYDGLGRTVETRLYETASEFITALHQYDSLGRVYKSSNPYRPYLNEQPQWTETRFDDLGRIIEVKTPDNAKVTRQYYGSSIRVFDQALRSRAGVSDALGRLIKVIEYDNGADLETFYTYDVLGRLRKTSQTQGETTQNRYFMYDDLGRLIRAKQVEQTANSNLSIADPVTGNSQWSVKYEYDYNGNVVSTTDSRNITLIGSYDSLNRLTSRDYSDSTPDVSYTFDDPNISNSKGKLTAVSSSVSSTFYTAFDELGRVKSTRQETSGQIYDFSDYSYDLSGALISQVYPSGRVVETESDDIGRLNKITSQVPNQLERTYLSHLSYTAFGAVEHARLGNGRWQSAQFDTKRLQTKQIGLGGSMGDTSLLKIEFDFGTTDNNGGLRQQKITLPGSNNQIVQNYTYDMLNRLKSATETVNSQVSWKQTFQYDRFGNREFDAGNTTTLPQNNNIYNPQIDDATNKFLVAEGYNYDSEGNLTSNPESQLFTYDGENRQIQVQNTASQTSASYFYDGNGKRIKKLVGQEETIFVYDAFGKLVAEYSTTQENRPKTISYLTTDDLGSSRVVTNQLGQIVSRHDYMPFGEEVLAGIGGRTTAHGYDGNDGVRQQFTGYEKDTESGLDFAQNRYFSGKHGRFTSVDPLMASANIKNPQTFNRFSYSLNSPYKFTDPLGLAACGVSASGYGSECTQGDDAENNQQDDCEGTTKRRGKKGCPSESKPVAETCPSTGECHISPDEEITFHIGNTGTSGKPNQKERERSSFLDQLEEKFAYILIDARGEIEKLSPIKDKGYYINQIIVTALKNLSQVKIYGEVGFPDGGSIGVEIPAFDMGSMIGDLEKTMLEPFRIVKDTKVNLTTEARKAYYKLVYNLGMSGQDAKTSIDMALGVAVTKYISTLPVEVKIDDTPLR